MSTHAEIQNLLRFLAHDAKIPLQLAITKVRELQRASLSDPESIAKANISTLTPLFPDEKTAKQVLTAAKRVSKKRTSSAAGVDTGAESPTSPKSARKDPMAITAPSPTSNAARESALALPTLPASDDDDNDGDGDAALSAVRLKTNRAPLVLAFALASLQRTRPRQPLSSRLSLAQALVAANSRAKAASIGLRARGDAMQKADAERLGVVGRGQPAVTVLGREVVVVRRVGYYDEGEGEEGGGGKGAGMEREMPLWGLDLEALHASNSPAVAGGSRLTDMPIYSPELARSYLLRAFLTVDEEDKDQEAASQSAVPKKKKPTAAALAKEKEHNCALLLAAIERLFESWEAHLHPAELDRRAWAWYLAVRPDVADGQAGWGGKGIVKLEDILALRRKE